MTKYNFVIKWTLNLDKCHKEPFGQQDDITIFTINDVNLEIEEEAADDVENVDQGQSQKQSPSLKLEHRCPVTHNQNLGDALF